MSRREHWDALLGALADLVDHSDERVRSAAAIADDAAARLHAPRRDTTPTALARRFERFVLGSKRVDAETGRTAVFLLRRNGDLFSLLYAAHRITAAAHTTGLLIENRELTAERAERIARTLEADARLLRDIARAAAARAAAGEAPR